MVYLLILLAFSGFPFFYDNDLALVVVTALVLFRRLFSGQYLLNKRILFVSILLLFLFVLQGVKFGIFPVYTVMGMFCRVILAAFVALEVSKIDFIEIYDKILTVICWVSLSFYVALLVFPDLEFLLRKIAFSYGNELFIESAKRQTLFIFNLNLGDLKSDYLRNSGPFWEPGAFGSFILLGVLFRLYVLKQTNIALYVLTIVTTVSTTAYLLMIVILLSFYFKSKSERGVFFVVLLMPVFTYIYFNTSFLNDKISDEIELAANSDLEGIRKNRVASMLLDVRDIVNHPMLGRGVSPKTRFDNPNEIWLNNRNSGLTDFAVRFGLPFFILFVGSIYKMFDNNTSLQKVFLTIICLLLGLSEPIFVYPFWLSFLFLK